MHLKLSTDRKFALSDENYLFDCMGLTKTTAEELSRMFVPRVTDFLKQSELVQALPKEADNVMKATTTAPASTVTAATPILDDEIRGEETPSTHAAST